MTVEERFWSKVAKSDGCWEWTAQITTTGYGHFWSGTHRDRAHRFSWELHHGPIPKGLLVLHRCDNKPCVRPDHLWLGTALDNTRDMFRKGRARRRGVPGALHWSAKFTDADVLEVRRLYAQGHSQSQIARQFGVAPSTVGKAVNFQTYKVAA